MENEREKKRREWWLKQMKKRSKESKNKPPPAEETEKEELDEEDEEVTEQASEDTLDKKRTRYILFIGNLPYSATSDDVTHYFGKRGVPIQQVRLLTEKGSAKSRGCGFLEFDNVRHQQNALRFHNSKLLGRTINLEVTCGGGGRGENRMSKIRKRNEKLTQNRLKQMS